MSKADLTVERLRELLDYNPETGVFTWLAPTSRRVRIGAQAASKSLKTGVRIGVDGRRYLAHRLAWLYMTGSWPDEQIDHINCDRFDNRWRNLRSVCNAVNQQNVRHLRRHNTSGYLGVVRAKKRHCAYLTVEGKTKYLGTYDTPEQAHEVYVQAKRRLHEGCTL